MSYTTRRSRGSLSALLFGALLGGTHSSFGAWISLSLPNLASTFASYQMDNLDDGRLVFGTTNQLYRQTTFQTTGTSVSLSPYTNISPNTWSPSSISLLDDTHGVIGIGSGAPGQIYTFNPSNLATSFTAIPGTTIQDYSLLYRDSAGIYVGGANGTGFKHAISYVSLSGATNQVLIDGVDTYSGGMALDSAGNLFVTGSPNNLLYKFSAAKLSLAISQQQTLTLADGVPLATLEASSTIAVDALDRVWVAGYGQTGLRMFDPQNGLFTSFTPGLANENYVVGTFSDGSHNYVSYLNAAGFSQGDALTYGFDRVENLVPEPGSGALLLVGLAVFLRRRR